MQEQVLAKVDSKRLQPYFIWTPAYGTDDDAMAKQGVGIVKDPRVRHFWDKDRSLALTFGTVVKVPRDSPLAYDVFFLFGSSIEFKAEAPEPTEYWHQILEDEKYFDAIKIVKEINRELFKLR